MILQLYAVDEASSPPVYETKVKGRSAENLEEESSYFLTENAPNVFQ